MPFKANNTEWLVTIIAVASTADGDEVQSSDYVQSVRLYCEVPESC